MADNQFVDIVEIFEGEDRQWYYRGKSNNGEILFTSEGYTEKSSAAEAGSSVAGSHAATVIVDGVALDDFTEEEE